MNDLGCVLCDVESVQQGAVSEPAVYARAGKNSSKYIPVSIAARFKVSTGFRCQSPTDNRERVQSPSSVLRKMYADEYRQEILRSRSDSSDYVASSL
jgi:hypothetical protein